MKKAPLTLVLIVLFTYCTSREDKRIEQQNSDSIALLKINEEKEIKRKTDSITHINDSILRVNDSIAKVKAEFERVKRIKNTVKITSCYLSSPNSAGGCDINIYFTNKSKTTIKYFDYNASFKNGVDDIVTCDIRGNYYFAGRDTGPFKPGRIGGGVWDCAIYNWSAEKVVINSIDIEFMDGSTISIKGNDLKLIGLKERQINL